MGRQLADDIADDFNRVVLNMNHFAVEVVYTPIDTQISRPITVQAAGINGSVRHESHHLTDDRMIVVWARRDAEFGIDNPQIGDTLTFAGTDFSFDAVSGESSSEFALRFKAVKRNRTGHQSSFRN